MAQIYDEDFSSQHSTISGYSSQTSLFVVTVIFTALACLVILGRLYARLFIAKQAGLDDALIFIAGIFSLAFGVTTWKQTEWGMGKHAWQFPHEDKSLIVLWFWASIWCYYAALGITKISILLQYLRIFPQVTFRRMCYSLLFIIVVWSLWAVLSAVFMCRPVSVFWKSQLYFDDARCLSRTPIWYSNAAISILTDCAIAILPMRVIHSLEIPRRQRQLLIVLFGVGFVTCFISLLRLVYIYPMAVNPDITWHTPLFCIWSGVEMNIAIVCSSTPAMKGLIKRVWPQILRSLSSGRGSASSQPDSAFTAINSATTNSSTPKKFFKGGNVTSVEAQIAEKPRRGLLQLLFGTRKDAVSPSENDAFADDVALQPMHRPRGSTCELHQDRSIGVQTVVDQYVDFHSETQSIDKR